MSGISGELIRLRVHQAAAMCAVVVWGLAQAIDFVIDRS